MKLPVSIRMLLFVWIVPAILVFSSCKAPYFSTSNISHSQYKIGGTSAKIDSGLFQLLKPYADSVNSTMNVPIGRLAGAMDKKWPDCLLGFFMTDAFLTAGSKDFGIKADIALTNTGGIRLNELKEGTITNGKVFELMPFDNVLVLIQLSGSQLQTLLDNMALKGPWPISGVTFTINNNKATDVIVQGKPIDAKATYTLITTDYVANGGDTNAVLKGLAQQNRGYLARNAIIDYIINQSKNNSSVPIPQKGLIKGISLK